MTKNSLAKAKSAPSLTLATAAATVKSALVNIADRLGNDLTTAQTTDIYSTLSQLSDVVTQLSNIAKEKLKLTILLEGERVTEAGTRRLQKDGWQLEVRPYRTGFDPKKIERLLRAKAAALITYMDSEVTYKVNSDKLLQAVTDGVFTKDELDTCKYDESWTMQPPRRVINE